MELYEVIFNIIKKNIKEKNPINYFKKKYFKNQNFNKKQLNNILLLNYNIYIKLKTKLKLYNNFNNNNKNIILIKKNNKWYNDPYNIKFISNKKIKGGNDNINDDEIINIISYEDHKINLLNEKLFLLLNPYNLFYKNINNFNNNNIKNIKKGGNIKELSNIESVRLSVIL